MKKKMLSTFLCIAVSLAVFAGCGPGSETEKGGEKDSGPDTSSEKDPAKDTGSGEAADTKTDDGEAGGTSDGGKKISLSMPSQSQQRWSFDAANMKKELEAKGYSVDVQFAEDDPAKQAEQIEQMIAAQADCLVIAATEPGELAAAADAAKSAGIPVIAYDRLIMDTDAVYYYVSFDNKGTGTMIGKTIAEKAGLDNLADGEYKTIEFFIGSADDKNARLVYNGLMEVLQPYLDSGRLICRTERTSFDDTSIKEWSPEKAKQRCEDYLAGYYTEEELDICAAASDGLASGCISAMQAAGYTASNWPVISGQDCELDACKNILDGTQSFSIYKDSRVLAQKCAAMVEAVLNGTEAEINDTEQYDNNKLIVPAYLCTPQAVDKDNLKEVLVDGGYYTQEQIDAAES